MNDRLYVIDHIKDIISLYGDKLQAYNGLLSYIGQLMRYAEIGNGLKSCPFCGGEADYIIKPDDGIFVKCRRCGNRTSAKSDYHDGEFLYKGFRAIDQVRALWNDRKEDET